MKEEKFVYVFTADCEEFGISGWMVKIGISSNVRQRFSNVQSGCPFKLWVQSTGKTYRAEHYEIELHELLSESRLRGEWFLLSDEQLDLVTEKLKEITKEFRGEHALV